MPKSSKRTQAVRSKRPATPTRKPPVKPTDIKAEPDTMWKRLRKNPMAIVGVIIAFSMVITLGIGILESTQPAPTPTAVPTTPTLASEVTPVPSPTRPAAAGAPSARKTYASRPAQTIDVNKSYTATIVTDKGSMVFTLLPKVAPLTVNSFVFLAREGFYDGLTFHRVEPDFVIQGGDPVGNGTGGPGYSVPAEFNPTKHITGSLAMARSSDPNSAGSQFYVTLSPQPGLDNQYTVFGQIVSGMDVALKIARGDVMRKVTIEEQ